MPRLLVIIAAFAMLSSASAAEIPALPEKSSLPQIREIARQAGWNRVRKPYCRAEASRPLDETDDPPPPKVCLLFLPTDLLRAVPEIVGSAGDHAYINLCYDDGRRHALIITVTYREQSRTTAALIASMRSAGWRIESSDCKYQWR